MRRSPTSFPGRTKPDRRGPGSPFAPSCQDVLSGARTASGMRVAPPACGTGPSRQALSRRCSGAIRPPPPPGGMLEDLADFDFDPGLVTYGLRQVGFGPWRRRGSCRGCGPPNVWRRGSRRICAAGSGLWRGRPISGLSRSRTPRGRNLSPAWTRCAWRRLRLGPTGAYGDDGSRRPARAAVHRTGSLPRRHVAAGSAR